MSEEVRDPNAGDDDAHPGDAHAGDVHGDGRTPAQRAPGAWAFRTASGSLYAVMRDADGQWWLTARNVPSDTSVALPPAAMWMIAPPTPWPLEIGRPVAMLAPPWLALDDPARVPGGGKITSPVVAVVAIEPHAPRTALDSETGDPSRIEHTSEQRRGPAPRPRDDSSEEA
jgi:hypothetical protein